MITIFTPTYNRASLLKDLKVSLDNQTCYDFEWVIVDDGSTDGTESQVNEWIGNGTKYPLRYFKQENQGKPSAFNNGVQHSTSEFFICVDSDDTLTNIAVEIINNDIANIGDDLVGLVYPRLMSILDNTLWEEINGREIDMIDLKELYRIKESAIVMRKNILAKYPFPIFEQEKFIPEGWLYQKLSIDGKFKAINKTFYVSEYQEDGMTNNMWNLWSKNPNGVLMTLSNKFFVLGKYSLILKFIARIKCIINFNTICFASNCSVIKRTPSKLYSFLLYLPSIYFYKRRFK